MVTVFGLGFVGLTTAVGLAKKGYHVYGFDIDQHRLDLLKLGKLPFLETGLDTALPETLNKTLFLDQDLKTAITNSEYIFYCVGTPYGEGGEADLGYLFTAITQTINVIKDDKFRVLITKSTIPPSTTSEKILPFVVEKGKGLNLGVANNPEFLREGVCWDDFMNPDRIVFGVNDIKSEQMLRTLYQPFNAPMYSVSHNTGEYIKYLSNTMLATLISYSNEMSVIADLIGDIDTAKAFKIIHEDKRWGSAKMTSYLYPGCGYGGYCLPKDTNALNSLVKLKGGISPILQNVIDMNELMPDVTVSRIQKVVTQDKTIGILGLSFKPNSDDVRHSPATKIIEKLLYNGYKVLAYDPVAIEEYKIHYPYLHIEYISSLEEIIIKADCLAITTAWDEFRQRLANVSKPIVDCRFMFLSNDNYFFDNKGLHSKS